MENNKQQTPIEWQHIELSKFLEGKSEFTDAHDILIKAKEMEKKRMIEFAQSYAVIHCMGDITKNAEEYFNETYQDGK
jgi:hypothetical protein